MYEIEKNIPVPKIKLEGTGKNQILIRSLQVEDSFLIPDGKMCGASIQQFRDAAKKYGIKITTRTVEGGVRIWRIE